MECDQYDSFCVNLVIADDPARWGDISKQLQEKEDHEVKVIFTSLLNLLRGEVLPERHQVIVATFTTVEEVEAVRAAYPLAQLALGIEGTLNEKVFELLILAPMALLRLPPRFSEVSDLITGCCSAKNSSQLKLAMRASFTSREVGVLKSAFPLGDWLLRARIIGQKEQRALQVAFQEALTNSLEHGNLELLSEWKNEIDDVGRDRYFFEKQRRLAIDEYGDRLLHIETTYDGCELEISIEDSGSGFDIKQLNFSLDGIRPQIVAPDTCYGRGLALIFAYMDQVRFNPSGTKITMVKRFANQVQEK